MTDGGFLVLIRVDDKWDWAMDLATDGAIDCVADFADDENDADDALSSDIGFCFGAAFFKVGFFGGMAYYNILYISFYMI